VTGVPGHLFEEVHEYPAKIDEGLGADVPTDLIETGSSRYDRIDLSPDFLVSDSCRFDRVLRVD
jgi:hypothetical protein